MRKGPAPILVNKSNSGRICHMSGMNDGIKMGIGESDVFLDFQARLSRVAGVDRSVLIIGERGSGKELAVQRIHYLSARWQKNLVAVNCAALPSSLIESELFGYEQGAFTGAVKTRKGRFEEAEGGTLFLDEVGNLTPDTQQMLLRAIQERRYRPVGGKEDKTADVRIIAATNEDLQKAVSEKRFRQDLLYRLQEYAVTVPPLRESSDDIMPLSEFFREQANMELERNVKGFDQSARKALLTHSWPGNVRELRLTVQAAVLHTAGDMVSAKDLEITGEHICTSCCFTLKDEELEKERILRALEQAEGNRNMASQILGIGRTTLYRKMMEYGLKYGEK